MKNLKTTNLFILINDETLETMKEDEKTMKFETESDADKYASSKIESWSTCHIHFLHKFINHTL